MSRLVPDLDPILTLAQTLHATPTSHMLLLGAGVSIAAGVPSAWGVQERLVEQLAAQHGEKRPKEPEEWFRAKFGTALKYDSLLEALGRTMTERQQLLRQFFEPSEGAIGIDAKRPSAAHHAIAGLVAAGSVRIVVTLNFDRLVETAIREQGIEPTIAASPNEISGLAPLHTLDALVVHLHGDYLTPRSMLNTASELARYPPVVNRFLNRLLADHGVIAVGWSADYDPSLVAALKRTPSRHFTSYWINPGTPSTAAEELRIRIGAPHIRASADDALGRLFDASAALASRHAKHALTVPVAVATTKRFISGHATAVGLHDALHAEFAEVRRLPEFNRVQPGELGTSETYEGLLGSAQEGVRVAEALIATAAYWGNQRTDSFWVSEIERFAQPSDSSGITALLDLEQLPAVHFSVAATVAAVASGRLDLAHRLLADQWIGTRGRDRSEPAAVALSPSRGLPKDATPNASLHRRLADLFVNELGITQASYDEAWEKSEVLRLVVATFLAPDSRTALAAVTEATQSMQTYKSRLAYAKARTDLSQLEQAEMVATEESVVERGETALSLKREDLAKLVSAPHPMPHVRVRDSYRNFKQYPVIALQMAEEVRRQGTRHPVVTAGFCGGNDQFLEHTLIALSDALANAQSSRPFLGAMYFWLDTGEVPADG